MRKHTFILILMVFVTACGSRVKPTQSPPPSQTPVPASTVIFPSPTESPSPTASLVPTTAPTLIPYASPAWFQNAVLYEVFVRSFVDSDGDGIGDLAGITERLDYLEELSVDVIWLLPIYPSPSVHGYDVSDHFGVNPEYGTLEDFQALVDAVHARGMKIILDFVPSHLSNQNPLFEDAYRNPNSIYSDWFVWTNDAHTLYAGFAGNETMPRFNHYNPEVVDYLAQAALYWLDLDGDGDYRDGVDGFRVDNVTFPPQEFFVTLRQAIKAVNPDALLLGESWVHTPSDLSRFYQDQFDALFDFPLYELLQGNQDSNSDGLLASKGFPALLTILLEEEADRYPDQAIAVRFLSNHDTNRIATELAGDLYRQRLAVGLLAAFPGSVMVYYGEEIGMFGQKGGPPHWDNYRREPMDWYAGEVGVGQTTWFHPEDRWNQPGDGISVEEQEADPDSLLNFYRQCLNTRQKNSALSEGDFSLLEMEVLEQGPWGFVRSAGGEIVVAIFNFADEERQVTVNEFSFSATLIVDLLSGEEFQPAEEGQPYELTLPPAAALWLSGE